MQPPRIVMIFGISPRSGTNFLRDLLCLHPDFVASNAFFEDGFALFADHLDSYARQLTNFYGRFNRIHQKSEIMGALGSGLQSLLLDERSADVSIVSKTPYATGLEHVPALFPDVLPIVVVRNGLSVAASAKRTWGTRVSTAAHRWAMGARAIDEFRAGHPDVQVIRFEELVVDPLETTRSLVRLAGRDPDLVDSSMVEALGVRGSSELTSSGEVHWEPVARPKEFDPTRRAAELTDSERRRFFAVAGNEQRLFGYDGGSGWSPASVVASRVELAAYHLAVRTGRASSALGE